MNSEVRSIKQWAWFGIIFGTLAILPAMGLLLLIVVGGGHETPIDWLERYSIVFGITGLLFLTGGIQLLRQRESGRKIYLLGAFIIFTFSIYRFISGFFIFGISNKLNWLAGLIIQLIFPIWIIYFFTRPKIKGQFK